MEGTRPFLKSELHEEKLWRRRRMKKRRLVYFVLVVYYVGRCGGFGRRRGAMTKIYYMNFFPIKKKENEMRKIQSLLPKCSKATWFKDFCSSFMGIVEPTPKISVPCQLETKNNKCCSLGKESSFHLFWI